MANLSVSYASIIAKHAHLDGCVPQRGSPHFEDYEIVMGTNVFAEAYADEESRNAKLGSAGAHVKFVPANGDTFADEDDYPLERMAIGHTIHEPGFDLVAPHVVGAILDFFGDEKTRPWL